MYRSRTLARVLLHQKQAAKLLARSKYASHLTCLSIPDRRNISSVAVEDGYVKKFMKAIGWMDQNRTRLKLSGYFLYESVLNQVDYEQWFKQMQLPDTFSSWFAVTELHVWLLMVRCMAEDVVKEGTKEKYVKGDGFFVRNTIVEALWADVGNRIKLLEGANPAIARKQVSELSEQFQAAIIGYDEGLKDDRTMAAAVWRRFYGLSPDVHPENVEKIVLFVRSQLSQLDKLNSETLKKANKISWLTPKAD